MNADDHLSPDELIAYGQRTLAPAALLPASDHLASCERCRAALREANPLPAETEAATYEELAAAVSGEADPLARRRLRQSRQSVAELADLLAFRDEMDALPAFDYSLGEEPARSRASWILPIAAGLAFAFALFWLNSSGRQASRGLVLHDAGKKIVVRQDGTVPALGPLSEGLRDAVRVAASSGKVELPPLVRELRPAAETLAGAPTVSQNFSPVSPIGTAVATAQPTLRWSRDPDATGYRVNLQRRSGGAVLTSPSLTAEQSEWTPPQPLVAGETYEWDVEALRGEEMIGKAPAPPEPEACFAVLPNDKQKELSDLRAQLQGSHLLLGLAYARAGLVPEARAEFGQLAQDNPESQLPKDLLASLTIPTPANAR